MVTVYIFLGIVALYLITTYWQYALVLALILSAVYFFRSRKKPKPGEIQNVQQKSFSFSMRDTFRPGVAKRGGYDLVEITNHYPTCSECSKYQGRVFSISGRDRRFPKLPAHILQSGNIHEGCKHTVVPYVDNLQTAHEIAAAMKRSNTPFIDSRSKTERSIYDKQQKQHLLAEEDLAEYEEIKRRIPEAAPKSFAGYRRMKSSRSKNYRLLLEKLNKGS